MKKKRTKLGAQYSFIIIIYYCYYSLEIMGDVNSMGHIDVVILQRHSSSPLETSGNGGESHKRITAPLLEQQSRQNGQIESRNGFGEYSHKLSIESEPNK